MASVSGKPGRLTPVLPKHRKIQSKATPVTGTSKGRQYVAKILISLDERVTLDPRAAVLPETRVQTPKCAVLPSSGTRRVSSFDKLGEKAPETHCDKLRGSTEVRAEAKRKQPKSPRRDDFLAAGIVAR